MMMRVKARFGQYFEKYDRSAEIERLVLKSQHVFSKGCVNMKKYISVILILAMLMGISSCSADTAKSLKYLNTILR